MEGVHNLLEQFNELSITVKLILGTVFLAFIVSLIPILFSKKQRMIRRKTRKRSVLLLGPCGAGKTVLIFQLCHGEIPQTVTSMKENVMVYNDEELKKPVEMIDFPGHERLRSNLLSRVEETSAIIVLLDSNNMKAHIRPTAEILFDILTHPSMENNPPPLLVVCNKQDLPNAKAEIRIKKALELELDNLKKTRGKLSDVLLSADQTDPKTKLEQEQLSLGQIGKPFAFDVDSPCQVEFCKASITQGNVQEIKKFMTTVFS